MANKISYTLGVTFSWYNNKPYYKLSIIHPGPCAYFPTVLW